MQKLHIVHTEASLGWGGQEIRILTEARGMAERGHRVTLLCPPEATIHREGVAAGLDVVPLPIGRKKPIGIAALRRWLRERAIDVINTHSSTDAWLMAVAATLCKAAPPMVRTRHISAPVPDNFATRWLYGVASTHIVTTGERLRNTLIDDNGFDPRHITSVPTGIDTQRYIPGDRRMARRQLGLPEEAHIVGIVATLRSWKGHSYLLEAFAGLADRSARLLIVGDGPQRTGLEKLVGVLNLTDRVLLPGNQADVVPWLQALDVFALPSYANEGVPQAILQAMSCGIPVVSTSIGSILEALRDGETGLVVPERQVEPLRGALEKLLGDAELRLRLGDTGRLMVVEKFGIEVMLDKMEAIFQRAVHG
jgi:glycosyltransferase involved in cell wall biosynthesis